MECNECKDGIGNPEGLTSNVWLITNYKLPYISCSLNLRYNYANNKTDMFAKVIIITIIVIKIIVIYSYFLNIKSSLRMFMNMGYLTYIFNLILHLQDYFFEQDI